VRPQGRTPAFSLSSLSPGRLTQTVWQPAEFHLCGFETKLLEVSRVILDVKDNVDHYSGMTGQTAFRFATLPTKEASDVVAAHPELADPESTEPIVVAVTAHTEDEAAALSDFLAAAGSALFQHRGVMQDVLRALLPRDALRVGRGVLIQVRRNAQAQAALATEFGLLSSAEVASLAGSKATNASALASRWRREQMVFSVDVDSAARYPGFQFGEDGKPVPVVQEVIAALGEQLSPWELALWFAGSNAWLGGERPVDVLISDPAEVISAATHLAVELVA
jgi:hypothetical protein